jgi:hypothetical protein
MGELTMWQDIISGVAILLLGYLIKIAVKRNKERKAHEEAQLSKINNLLAFQSKHTEETNTLNGTIKGMQRELTLTRVDTQCVTYALEMASNGDKFKDYIEEKRNELMAKLEFIYKD